jgi:uncharacterized coiled-coil DUF342 family protein
MMFSTRDIDRILGEIAGVRQITQTELHRLEGWRENTEAQLQQLYDGYCSLRTAATEVQALNEQLSKSDEESTNRITALKELLDDSRKEIDAVRRDSAHLQKESGEKDEEIQRLRMELREVRALEKSKQSYSAIPLGIPFTPVPPPRPSSEASSVYFLSSLLIQATNSTPL